ncbi:HDOD domain-containing protein [Litoribacillus peritrichatus]|uniref:HDOD domain-containing protein n=1 Tax=Litoribacillus peritrichatus TaxID=718191 RepID=A0ABP7MP19_9GAMM
METNKRPNTAEGWAHLIKDQALPLLPNTSAQLITALKQTDLPFSKLAALIHRDPVACLYLIKFANQQCNNPDTEIHSPDLAISMLGMDKVRTIMKKLPTLKLNPRNIAHREYLQSICNSLHAAAQVDHMAESKPILPRELLYWSTLFAGTGYWLMWSTAPHEMRIAQYLTFEERMPMEKAQRQILGCTVLDISQHLGTMWRLPTFTQASMLEGLRPTSRQLVQLSQACPQKSEIPPSLDRNLKLMMNSLAFPTFLGNFLAMESYKNWHGRNFDRALSIYGTYMGIDHQTAYQRIRDTAIQVSAEHPIPYILLPAKHLLQIPSDISRISKPSWAGDDIPDSSKKRKANNKTTSSQATTSKARSSSSGIEDLRSKTSQQGDVDFVPKEARPRSEKHNPALDRDVPTVKLKDKRNMQMFSELTNNMLKHPERFQDIHELMNAAVQCIKYGLGLERSSASLISASGHKLVAYYTAGMMDSPKLADLVIDLKRPSIFQKLSQKPLGAWINKSNLTKLRTSIPSTLTSASQAHYFFVQSIFAKGKPVVIIYADSGARGDDFTEEDYKYFKVLCRALGHCVEHFSERKATLKKSQQINP